MDCDRVVVMSDGVAVEVGAPLELLQRPDSVFAAMASGDAAATALLKSHGLTKAVEEVVEEKEDAADVDGIDGDSSVDVEAKVSIV